MVRILRRLALLTVCALVLSAPALAHDGWRGHRRSNVVVVVNSRHHDWDDGWYRGRRVGWRGCDLPPGLAWRYGCYDRPVVLVPRYYGPYYGPYYRPYYRPRSGVSVFFSVR